MTDHQFLLEIGNSTVKLATRALDGEISIERYSNLEALVRRVESARRPLLVARTGRALGEEIFERLSDVADVTTLDRRLYDSFVEGSYDNPATLGFDRILNLAGLEGDGIVVSCGTAITVDALSDGRPLWGAILPGFTTAADGLHSRIPQLPLVSTRMPTSLPARDSITSVANGVMLGVAYGTRGIVSALAGITFGGMGRVVLTGGEAEVMRRLWGEEVAVDDALLFRGMLKGASGGLRAAG